MFAKVDIAIIGAGVVGLAIAYELSRSPGKTIAVLEKNQRFGQETSSRNSEVIHSGIYYPATMLKTRLCMEGNYLLYQFCQQQQVPHRRLGKLIVASDSQDCSELERLYRNGQQNGVAVEQLSSRQVARLEPSIKVSEGLFLPSTGIIDSHELMQKLYYHSKAREIIYLFDSELIGLENQPVGYQLKTSRETIEAEVVINAAGLMSAKVSQMLGIDPLLNHYQIYPCKGDYYRLRKRIAIHHPVYPLPGQGVLGIHITPDLQGNLRLGPNAYYVNELDYRIDDTHQEEFYNSIKRFLPFLNREDIMPDYTGIRPKLQGPGDPLRDFVIREESDKGWPGFINLIGIESPGLTSSLAIARYVKELYISKC